MSTTAIVTALVIAVMWTPAATREGGEQEKASAAPIDFDRIERTITKLPELSAADPGYVLFLFGLDGEARSWAVFDRSEGSEVYDVLYFDLDADGDLSEDGERFTRDSGASEDETQVFSIGAFVDPGSKATHQDFTLSWSPTSVRYSMRWRGDRRTMGCYGPWKKSYATAAASPKGAPVFVPGYDRPFEFEHWMSGTLKAGTTKDFKVFVGNRGDRRGAFSCVDDKFLPRHEYPVATLVYTDTSGEQQRVQAKLTERC